MKVTARGYSDKGTSSETLELGDFGDLFGIDESSTTSIRLGQSRDGETSDLSIDDIEDDDVIELELKGGIKVWGQVDQLAEDYPQFFSKKARGAGWELSAEGSGTSSRGGVVDELLGIRRLKVWIKDKFIETGAEWAGQKIVEAIEGKLIPVPGLHLCRGEKQLSLQPDDGSDIDVKRPVLLMLHGTGSSTEGSFGELWREGQRAEWIECLRGYRGQVFAFEHFSLSQSPIENARDIAERLPVGTRLHLMSHSRGGLVGELLCRAQTSNRDMPFTADEIDLFSGEGHARNKQALIELNELLQSKRFKVERFVRVACPARGTTLASGRLDRYLSVLLNIIGQIPVLKASPVYEAFSAFMLAVIKQRTRPEEIPGIEAMMPTSPLIMMLNGAQVELDADLSVIAGDFEGTGFFGSLWEFTTNLYYLSRHDLVVNTEAMYGGGRRAANRSRYFFDDGSVDGSKVNHFLYFSNERTVRRLIAGLSRSEGEDAGFQSFTRIEDVPKTARFGARGGNRPVVFVLPGILGSNLAVADDRVWMDIKDLFWGGFSKIAIDKPDVVAESLIGSVYSELLKYLGQSHEVIPFPFDWRLPIHQEAARLAEEVEESLNGGSQTVRILAHSMGGLVARTMIASRPDLWEKITAREGGRLLMLGTPNGGSFAIPQILLGEESTVGMLGLLDVKHSEKELLHFISRYPGILEMLPDPATSDRDYFDQQVWKDLRPDDEPDWPLPRAKDLKAAKKLRELLDGDAAVDKDNMFYIAGHAEVTPNGVEKQHGEICFEATRLGDGRVTWATGLLPEVKTWYARIAHGDLPAPAVGGGIKFGVPDRPDNHFEAIREILQSGDTQRLSTQAPVEGERGITAEKEYLPASRVHMYPDEQQIISAALGRQIERKEKQAKPQLSVSFTHGDLAFASHPVVVGHYRGDTMISAERYLDMILEHRLTARYELGIYPGAIETTTVLLNTESDTRHYGAIVVGLGQVGNLSPGGLARSVTFAMREFAVKWAETGADKPPAITTLLIGTSAGGVSIADSISAVLRGVLNANDAIYSMNYEENACRPQAIAAVEFIELYQDRAVEATHILAGIANEPGFRDRLVTQPMLVKGNRGLKRLAYREPPGWWRRIEIISEADGSLKFTTLTDRARADIRLLPTQRRLVDAYVEKAITSTSEDIAVSTTLFELLLPNALKEAAPDQTDMVLVLDEGTAHYPWELMRYRAEGDAQPLALQAGVLRQLAMTDFPETTNTSVQANALVIGDPPSKFAPLPGAVKEAKRVEKLLETGYEVISRIKRPTEDVINALYQGPYQIIHLAGHGVYEYAESEDIPPVTGMVIGEGMYLTPVEVRQMREIPELVFINCCHLGYSEGKQESVKPDRHKLAANLAQQFIMMGVRAVVAAGWAVDDAAAETFAATFYDQMLAGKGFGDAVLRARQETQQAHPQVNTWGAYQCYGDQDYSLRRGSHGRRNTARKHRYVCVAEVVVKLNNMTAKASTASKSERESLKETLKDIEALLPEDWKNKGELQAALALTHGELAQFEAAIKYCTLALAGEQEMIDLRLIEQMANFKVRWAEELNEKNKKTAAKTQVSEAIILLQHLMSIGETVERLSLMAGAYKRLALIHPQATTRSRQRIDSLKKMAEFYRRSYELHLQRKQQVYPYPLLNWMAAVLILERVGQDREKEKSAMKQFDGLLNKARHNAEVVNKGNNSFWYSIVTTECELLKFIKEDVLTKEENQQAIIDGYARPFYRGSARERASVYGHLQFLQGILGSTQKQSAITCALQAIREALIRRHEGD